jgi:hypothetical protein
VAVTSPPVEGKANAACIRALADALGVARSSIALDPASRSRRKRVEVAGDPESIVARLAELAIDPRGRE